MSDTVNHRGATPMEKTINITPTWADKYNVLLHKYNVLLDKYNVLLEAARQVCDDGEDTDCDSCWVVSDNTFSKLVELTGM
jgi:hypothetical protein